MKTPSILERIYWRIAFGIRASIANSRSNYAVYAEYHKLLKDVKRGKRPNPYGIITPLQYREIKEAIGCDAPDYLAAWALRCDMSLDTDMISDKKTST